MKGIFHTSEEAGSGLARADRTAARLIATGGTRSRNLATRRGGVIGGARDNAGVACT
jgi:hypothetical protein